MTANFALVIALLILLGILLSYVSRDLLHSLRFIPFFLFPAILLPFLKSSFIKRIVFILSLLCVWIVTLFEGIEGFLGVEYGVNSLSSYTIESLSNTTRTESYDFLLANALPIALWASLIGLICLIQYFLISALNKLPKPINKGTYIFAGITCCVFVWSIYSDPWRAYHPIQRALNIVKSLKNWNTELQKVKEVNTAFLSAANTKLIRSDQHPRTIILVIGESTNRNNMQLYGYPRKTTPLLSEISKDSRFRMSQLAFSVQPATIGSVNSMMVTTDEATSQKSHMLAVFKKAGFKIFWISNQDDSYIKTFHQYFADKAVNLNLLPGRSSRSLDENVLPELSKALEDQADKKLIIVHLIGIHPHFAFRYPKNFKESWNIHDEIDNRLKESGRSFITRNSRNDYDRAMLYQDRVISQAIKIAGETNQENVSLVYLSDHGVETGQSGNHVGHSHNTIHGYTIPLLLWTNEKDLSLPKEKALNTPFRADWLSYLLFDLAKIDCNSCYRNKSWINKSYDWKEPAVITRLKEKK